MEVGRYVGKRSPAVPLYDAYRSTHELTHVFMPPPNPTHVNSAAGRIVHAGAAAEEVVTGSVELVLRGQSVVITDQA